MSFTFNFSGNANEYPNATAIPGCLGGFGGGGQGGYVENAQNFSIPAGGGGGGGGWAGGQTSVSGEFGICTAGGPGKPFCDMKYCDVAKINDLCTGFFKIGIRN